jgi:hypothetical protein
MEGDEGDEGFCLRRLAAERYPQGRLELARVMIGFAAAIIVTLIGAAGF